MSGGHGPWCPHGEEYRCERCEEEAAHERAQALQREATAATIFAVLIRLDLGLDGSLEDRLKVRARLAVSLADSLREELER